MAPKKTRGPSFLRFVAPTVETLRELGGSGTQVVVTGSSGDGGIDGHGVLEINPLVTFEVLFQCKRYGDRAVTPSQVRDFRGAMQGPC